MSRLNPELVVRNLLYSPAGEPGMAKTPKIYSALRFEQTEPMPAPFGQRVIEKGWVREKILSILLQGPTTLSDVSGTLGISKSTAAYHLKRLLNKGIIEISDIRNVRGGVYAKTLSLKSGRVVLSEPPLKKKGTTSTIRESYQRLKLGWSIKQDPAEVIVFLYHLFVASDGVPRQERYAVFQDYGRLAGEELLSPLVPSRGLGSEVEQILQRLGSMGLALCTREAGDSTKLVIQCSAFFGSTDPTSPVFRFLQGLIEGALSAKHEGRYEVKSLVSIASPPRLIVARRRFQ